MVVLLEVVVAVQLFIGIVKQCVFLL
jgi:hypothetical protein